MKRPWIAPLLLALAAVGCGGKGAGPANTHAASTPAPTAPITTTTASAGPADCNSLGINPQGMREGTCTHGGVTWMIVDRDHTLKLKTLWGRLAGVRTAKSLTSATANGDFLVASVTITNKLPSAQTFDGSGSQQAGLILDGALFREAVSAERQADSNSCQMRGKQIPAGQSVTCEVIFDVPTHAAGDVGRHGSGDLYLVDFGTDLAGSVLPQTIGQIRLYH